MTVEDFLGPLAALALALSILGLFLKGTILPRNSVPREDYDRAMEINAKQAAATEAVTDALKELVAVVRQAQKNGGI